MIFVFEQRLKRFSMYEHFKQINRKPGNGEGDTLKGRAKCSERLKTLHRTKGKHFFAGTDLTKLIDRLVRVQIQ